MAIATTLPASNGPSQDLHPPWSNSPQLSQELTVLEDGQRQLLHRLQAALKHLKLEKQKIAERKGKGTTGITMTRTIHGFLDKKTTRVVVAFFLSLLRFTFRAAASARHMRHMRHTRHSEFLVTVCSTTWLLEQRIFVLRFTRFMEDSNIEAPVNLSLKIGSPKFS